MTFPNINILFHWLVNTPELLQRACVVVVVVYLAIRMEWFRRSIKGAASFWRFRVITMLFFSALAIAGTHHGIVLDVRTNSGALKNLSDQATELRPSQAVIGFRDTMVLSAGLCAGPWVGLGSGLIAGAERYYLGGFVSMASGLATVILGLGAGLARQYWPKAVEPFGTLVVALIGTAIQRILILLLTQPHADALALTWETLIPVTVVNCFGCLLFLSVMTDLERDRLKAESQLAELRALHAQIEPHFINNTLNAIKGLIRKDPELASDYVIKLARFLDDTREIAKANSIDLQHELDHLERYLEIQQLRFPDKFSFQADISSNLLSYKIPPRTLLTLAENSLLHGRSGLTDKLMMRLIGRNEGNFLILRISDNGCGMSPERVGNLLNQPVNSERGSGNGLYQLNESLKMAFNFSAKIEIKSIEEVGTEITIQLPKPNPPC